VGDHGGSEAESSGLRQSDAHGDGSAKLIYSPAFWERAYTLIDARPHKCEKCGVLQYGRIYKTRGRVSHAEVRLVLRDGDKLNVAPENLAMGCTRCYHADVKAVPPREGAPAMQTAIPKG
jgi:hypothetical protein